MPDGFIDWLKGDDYSAFKRWLQKYFPNRVGGLTEQNWKTHRLYRQWVDTGRLDPAPQIAGLAPGVTEKAAQWKPPIESAKEPDEDRTDVGEQPEPPDIKGFAKIPFYDPTTGKIVSWTYERDPTFQQPISPWEQAQLDFQQQQARTEQQRLRRERIDTRTWQQMLADTQGLRSRQEFGRQEAEDIWSQQAMRQAFETARGTPEGGGGAPGRDWITRYQAETEAMGAPNPFMAQVGPSAITDAQRAVVESRRAAGQVWADPFTGAITPTRTSPVAGLDEMTTSLAGQSVRREKELSDLLAAQREKSKGLDYLTSPDKYTDLPLAKKQSLVALGMSVMGGEGGGGELDWQVQERQRAEAARKRGTTPEMPDWLSRMTGISGRVPETRQEIRPPSMQSWGRMPYSQREQFAGFVDYAGTSPFADVLDRMAMMQTGTPSGAGRARVRPAFQR